MDGQLYEACLKWILSKEGLYTDDPSDFGGATNYGITQHTYNAWLLSHKRPLADIKYISQKDVHDLYKEEFWDLSYAELYKYPLALTLFDTFIQFNPQTFNKFIDAAINTTPATPIAAKHDIMLRSDQLKVALAICETRISFRKQEVIQYPTQQKYLGGWIARDVALKHEISK